MCLALLVLQAASVACSVDDVRFSSGRIGTDAGADADTDASGPTPMHQISVELDGSGIGRVTGTGGLDCPGVCSVTLAHGSALTVTATAGTGSDFIGWGMGAAQACSGTGECALTVTGEVTVGAEFRRSSYALSVLKLGFGNGTVTSAAGGINCGSACSSEYLHGLDVVLTATPASDSLFTGWSGGICSGTASTCVVAMTQARSVHATFVSRNPVVSVFKDGTGAGSVFSTPAGINCTPVCSMTVPNGTRLTLQAVPHESSSFGGWRWDQCPGMGPCTFTVTDEMQFVVRFNRNIYTLGVSKSGAGAGTVTSIDGGIDCGGRCSAPYSHGHDVLLDATPMPGSVFSGWGGACTGRDACFVSMTSDRSVTATFQQLSP